jgi:hypothetical protein
MPIGLPHPVISATRAELGMDPPFGPQLLTQST